MADAGGSGGEEVLDGEIIDRRTERVLASTLGVQRTKSQIAGAR